MPRHPSRETFLGHLDLRIVGTQYCEAEARPGERVHFERETENPHDPKAVRVEDENFEKVGYLERRVVTWLARLIDEGKVSLTDVRVLREIPEKHQFEVRAGVYLTNKGKDILTPDRVCNRPAQAVHEMVLYAFQKAEDWNSPAVLEGLAEKLRTLLKRDGLPETHLLVGLLAGKARRFPSRAHETFADLTRSLSSCVVHNGVTVYFFRNFSGRKRSRYVLLHKALKRGQVTVAEIGNQGEVSYLKVKNHASRPVLVPEGQMLEGGKQNRMVRVTVVVPTGDEREIPVSCVEQGRWRWAPKKRFYTGQWAPPSVRRQARTPRGQTAVWQSVHQTMVQTGVHSVTGDLTEVLRNLEKHFGEIPSHFPFPSDFDPIGFFVGINGSAYAIDVFDSPQTARELWPVLLKSYYIQSKLERGRRRKTSGKEAKKFIEELSKGLVHEPETDGNLHTFEIDSPEVTGGFVMDGDRLCHLTATRCEKEIVFASDSGE